MVVIKATGMVSTPLCITALYNGTLVKSTLTGIGNDFIALKNRKAFYYWYLYEGMEECEFDEALNDFQSLMQDYEVIDESAKKAIKKQVYEIIFKKTPQSQTIRSCLRGQNSGTTFCIDKSTTSTSSPRYTTDCNGHRSKSSHRQSSKSKCKSEPREASCQRDNSLRTPSTDRRSSAYYHSSQRDECGVERSLKRKTPCCGLQSPSSSEVTIANSYAFMSTGAVECIRQDGQNDKSFNAVIFATDRRKNRRKKSARQVPRVSRLPRNARVSSTPPDAIAKSANKKSGNVQHASATFKELVLQRNDRVRLTKPVVIEFVLKINLDAVLPSRLRHLKHPVPGSHRGTTSCVIRMWQKKSPFFVKSRNRACNSEKAPTDPGRIRETKQSSSPFFRKFRQKKRSPDRTSTEVTPKSSPSKSNFYFKEDNEEMESSTGDKRYVHEEKEDEVGGKEGVKMFEEEDADDTKIQLPLRWKIKNEFQTVENSTLIEGIEREVRSLSIKSLDNLSPPRGAAVTEKSVQSSPVLRNKKTSTETDDCPDTTEGEDFASASDYGIQRKADKEALVAEISVPSNQTDVLLDRLILEAVSSMSIWRRKQRRGDHAGRTLAV
ncbi:hypothetical protein TcWFU_000386 [Taenia crassiceps]|uniref:Uncharacterized protein n=1 Tax=Taenia crassiceps TaxID=6207 RepID=A0ABR4Q352_9CEST